MSKFDVRERDLTRLRDVVAALRAPPASVAPSPHDWWGCPPELLAHDPGGPGVRWRALELLRDLLEVDSVYLHVVDPGIQDWTFGQEVDPGGPIDFWYSNMGSGGPADTPNDLPEEIVEWFARYWDNYGTSVWHSPDVAEWEEVVCSQDVSRRDHLEWAARVDQPIRDGIVAVRRVAPGRHAELGGMRDGWASYSERTRGYLELLKPHFMQAWLSSCIPEPPVTPAQRRVLELVRDGSTNRQVARELGITEATVRTHLQHAYEALGVNNRVAAVAAAFGSGGAPGAGWVPAQRLAAAPDSRAGFTD